MRAEHIHHLRAHPSPIFVFLPHPLPPLGLALPAYPISFHHSIRNLGSLPLLGSLPYHRTTSTSRTTSPFQSPLAHNHNWSTRPNPCKIIRCNLNLTNLPFPPFGCHTPTLPPITHLRPLALAPYSARQEHRSSEFPANTKLATGPRPVRTDLGCSLPRDSLVSSSFSVMCFNTNRFSNRFSNR